MNTWACAQENWPYPLPPVSLGVVAWQQYWRIHPDDENVGELVD